MLNKEEKITNKEGAELTDATADFKIYELGYLLVSSIPEEKLSGEAAHIDVVLEQYGNIVSQELPKEQMLAYPMDKKVRGKKQVHKSAYFGSMIFETGAEKIEHIKKQLEQNDHILRFLIIGRTKESLIAPKKNTVMDVKEKRGVGAHKEKVVEKIDEKEIDKEIEELVVGE